MASSVAETSDSRASTSSATSVCKRLKAAMSLRRAATWPSASLSKDTSLPYSRWPLATASFTAATTMRLTVLEQRAVATLTNMGRRCSRMAHSRAVRLMSAMATHIRTR